MSDWRHAVVHGRILAESTMEQRWILITCTPDCTNAGPFRVWSSEGDVYYCSACGAVMHWEREDDA
jgi:hypothetical protein